MNTWQDILRTGDPADERLAAEDAAAIRRRVVAAANERTSDAAAWPRPLAVAAVVVAMVAAGAFLGGRRASEIAPAAEPRTGERRQLQFDTPGGTRIIWIFNSELNLKATNP